ncbi:MAG: DNA translocase FtsK, partial [Firmicutes bacterium]|nr:DNA translocase FtsK [Bacillota bacterium]
RPSVDVITGLIKANIPSRISFAVSSQVDSRTILDVAGAEKLLGRGDMLFCPVGSNKPIRLQGAYLSDREVEAVVEYLKKQGVPSVDEIPVEVTPYEETFDDDDELLPQAVEILFRAGHASISLLQRRLKIGYARAARLIDIMERRGIVGPFEGSKPRAILMTFDQYRATFDRQK